MSSSDAFSAEEEQALASLTPEQRRLFGRLQERAMQEAAGRRQAEERATQEAERRRQAEQDTAAVRRAMEEEKAEQQQLREKQGLDAYIADEFQRNFHLPRLLPNPTTSGPKSSSEKIITTTTGRTSIVGKYYPLQLELWEGCEGVLETAFEEIHTALGSRSLFPSKVRINVLDEALLEDLPVEFAKTPLYYNELRTSGFLHEVLQKPVSRVINAFLATHKVFFDTRNAGANIRFISGRLTQISSGAGQEAGSGADNPAGSDAGSQTSNQARDGEQGAAKEAKKKPRVPNKVQPDCVVLSTKIETAPAAPAEPGAANEAREANTDDDDSDGENQPDLTTRRIALGEHKAAHRLRAMLLNRLLEKGIPQDYIVQMARRRATGIPSVDNKKTVPGSFPGQVYYTYALAQTFHYMVSAGILYGYVASGDTLTVLHIPPADPTKLMYRPFFFPQFGKKKPDTETAAEPPRAEPVAPQHSTIGLLSGLALTAWKADAQDERWRTDALHRLAKFPELPESIATSDAAVPDVDSPSSPADSNHSSKRGSDDTDDDDDDNNNRPRGRRQHLSTPVAHRPSVPSPLRWHESSTEHSSQHAWQGSGFGLRKPVFLQPSRFDPASFRPLRPYCTQACLAGLARGLPLDSNCPNVLLHQRAARNVMTADDVLPVRPSQQGQMLHPIRSIEELGRLLVLQLYGNIKQDCECFLNRSLYGRIGCLFKLTLTGYGYTFVAKGVQSCDRRRLQRETAVYEHLFEQQGRLVPVYLGIVELLLPYPRDDALLMTHMMLMSYGGPGLWSRALARRMRRGSLAGMDREHEAARTWNELQALGVDDEDTDNMENNFTWCDEAQRMMRIDFDCASVAKPGARLPDEHAATYTIVPIASAKRRRLTDESPPRGDVSAVSTASAAKRTCRRRDSESSLGAKWP